MAQFVLLVHEDEAAWAAAPQDVRDRVDQGHYDFFDAQKEALVAGNEFQPTSASLLVRGNEVSPVPAPAPGTEIPCGYFLIEAEDIDHAVRIAQQIPMEFGHVQVRPVQVWEPREDS